MKKIFSLFAAILFAGSMMAGTVTLTNAEIVAAGDAASGYSDWAITDGSSNTWNAHAIKNQHSKATSSNHYLQIKKYDTSSSTAYYIQIPNPSATEKIKSITMTVSSASKPMDGGGNTATLYFSASNSTSAAGEGVVSGTGDASVTIDATDLGLATGYITASAGVRIWDVTVTTAAPASVARPVISGETDFVNETEVSISCTTEGVTIYYTTDGSAPSASSTPYSAAFKLNSTTTVNAIAIKGDDKSEVASKEFTKMTPKTIAEAIAGMTATESAPVLFNDLTVTYVNGKNVYVKDATGYLLVYGTISGAANGSTLSGLLAKTKLYNKLPEASTIVEAPVVTAGSAVAPEKMTTVPAASDANKYVVISGVTVESDVTFSTSAVENYDALLGSDALVLRNSFKVAGSLVTGKTYDVEAVINLYNSTVQIYPISVTDTPTAIDETEAAGKATKELREGQVLIIKGNKTYNILGQEIR